MMNARGRHSDTERGSVLLIVLLMIVVLGLAAGIAASSWKTITQRAREAELLWRGDQYRKAIESYYTFTHGNASGLYPQKLENLEKDPRSLNAVRHIRRLYPDPMTGGDWTLIKDKTGRIIGVRSESKLTPFKKDGFPSEYESFKGAETYSSWEFVFEPKVVKKAETGKPSDGKEP